MVGCAHASVSTGQAKARPESVFVTGSHIAQRLDSRGEPQTAFPLRVYSREALLGTGRPGDLRQALQTLDPAISP
jgi:hypothetical protein